MNILNKIKHFSNTSNVALICHDNNMSYSDLEFTSENIGGYLLSKYEADKTPIVIYGNKDNLIMSCIMGCLKSGHAYIPLDVTFPLERVQDVIDEVGAKLLLNFTTINNFKNIDILSFGDIEKISKDDSLPSPNPENWVKGDENAYILFTSGSTGKPKGVQISSNNIDAFVEWFEDFMDIDDKNDIMMNQVSYSFDVSLIPIYIGLKHGKTLYSFPKDTLDDFNKLFSTLKESNLNYWVSTPALGEICINSEDFNATMLPNMHTMFFAGEVLSKNLVKSLMDKFPGVRIINGYGPTEGTVLLSAVDVNEDFLNDPRSLPIGYPTPFADVMILDENGNQVPEGEKGEIVAVGPNISRGYLNRPEITNKVFFDSTYKNKDSKGYKTGDIGYYENGLLYYCGRRDFQIKLNGFRIEIEDIENNLRKVSTVKNAIVLPVYKDEKISHLTGFVCLKENNSLSNLKNIIAIKKELANYIPSYMVPRVIKILDNFPMNTNGKIDRKKLMED